MCLRQVPTSQPLETRKQSRWWVEGCYPDSLKSNENISGDCKTAVRRGSSRLSLAARAVLTGHHSVLAVLSWDFSEAWVSMHDAPAEMTCRTFKPQCHSSKDSRLPISIVTPFVLWLWQRIVGLWFIDATGSDALCFEKLRSPSTLLSRKHLGGQGHGISRVLLWKLPSAWSYLICTETEASPIRTHLLKWGNWGRRSCAKQYGKSSVAESGLPLENSGKTESQGLGSPLLLRCQLF